MPGVDHETVIASRGSPPTLRWTPAGVPAARTQNSGIAATAAPMPAIPLGNWRRVPRAQVVARLGHRHVAQQAERDVAESGAQT